MVLLQDGFEFRQITAADKDQINVFDCGHCDTNEFFQKDVFTYHTENLGITFALLKDKKIVCLITIGMGAIRFPPNLVYEEIAVSERPRQLPALKIGRLATHKDHGKRGHARRIIQIITALALELRTLVGCRYIIVDAYPDRVDFYKKLGFQTFLDDFTGKETILMYISLPKNSLPTQSEV